MFFLILLLKEHFLLIIIGTSGTKDVSIDGIMWLFKGPSFKVKFEKKSHFDWLLKPRFQDVLLQNTFMKMLTLDSLTSFFMS